jgi:hypothetical protein
MTIPAFREVWFEDTEYQQPDGERPRPICVKARELRTGRVVQRWLWGQPNPEPPFAVGPDVLVVAYAAQAEWGVHLACGWPLPTHVLDLYAEYCCLMSGFKVPTGQLAAMSNFGIPHMGTQHKQDMRSLCIRGGPFSPDEARAVMTYCQEDVDGLAALFWAMEGHLHWPWALLRGRYTPAVALMEAVGMPLDHRLYAPLWGDRERICREYIAEKGATYGIYQDGTFNLAAFEAYLAREGILGWPRTEKTGRLKTDEKTFEEMVDIYPQLRGLYELRLILSQLKGGSGLSIGMDGRNRTSLMPWGTSTGRNAPSTTKFIFGKSIAFRHLIQPEEGMALAYLDYEQQEFAIGGVLSGDKNMIQAYGFDDPHADPYLAFGKQAGLLPADATKQSHGDLRDLIKVLVLAIGYGMGAESLARRINRPVPFARKLLNLYWHVYSTYGRWLDLVQNQGMMTSHLRTVFGWRVNVPQDTERRTPGNIARSLRNFLSQAHGAEMLRLACCLVTELGIRVVAPVHDALMIEAPAAEIEAAVAKTKRAMEEASQVVLNGFTLRVEHKIVRHPDHYWDKRGTESWVDLMRVLKRVTGKDRSQPLRLRK